MEVFTKLEPTVHHLAAKDLSLWRCRKESWSRTTRAELVAELCAEKNVFEVKTHEVAKSAVSEEWMSAETSGECRADGD